MKHRDGIFATLALVLSSFALAGMVVTDMYSAAAATEARGVNALTHAVQGGDLVASSGGINGAQSAAVQQ